MKTAFDSPDWESQMRSMLGEADAEEMIRTFTKIINEHEARMDEPFTIVEAAFTQDEVVTLLEACHMDALERHSADPLYLLIHTVGSDLARTYVQDDDMPPDETLSAAASFFLSTDDDWDGVEDEDED